MGDNCPHSCITNDNGEFVIENLCPGEYLLCMEGYYFKQNSSVIVPENGDIIDINLEVYLVEEGEPIAPSPPEEFGDRNPTLFVDDNGEAHLVWEHGREIWHSMFTNNTWDSMEQIKDVEGRNPTAVFNSQILGEDSPGIMTIWESVNESYNDQLWYSIGIPDNGGYLWSEAMQLTSDEFGDREPVTAITEEGEEVVLWLQRNWSAEDDTDLYYEVINVSEENLTWENQTLTNFDGLSSWTINGNSLDKYSLEYNWSIPKVRIPKVIPIINGEYGAEARISGSVEGGCDLSGEISGGIAINFSDRGSGSGKISGKASWKTDSELCEYVFNKASASLEASGSYKVPLWKIPTPKWLTVELGAQLSATLGGIATWEGSNFPSWPTGSNIYFEINPSLYGEANFFNKIKVNVEGGGKVLISWSYPEPVKVTSSLYVKASAKFWNLKATWEKKWGDNGGTYSLSSKLDASSMILTTYDETDEIPIYEELNITIDTSEGTGNLYEGKTVISDISNDLFDDGKPVITKSDTGEILVAWTKDSQDAEDAMGSSVVVSNFDGNSWSSPVTVDGPERFNKNTAITFVEDDIPLLLWSGAPANVTLDTPVEEIIEAIQQSEIFFSQRNGDTWSTPVKITDLDGQDEQVVITSASDSKAYAAWIHADEEGEKVYTAIYYENNNTWSDPIIISSGISCESPTITIRDGKPFLVWVEDTDGDSQTKKDSTLFWSEWDGVWSEPINITKPEELNNHSSTLGNSVASYSGESKGLGFIKPPEDCCIKTEELEPKDTPEIHLEQTELMDDHESKPVNSATPEDKYGPTGFDLPNTPPEERKHFITADQLFYYKIDFWNDEDANASANDVLVVDQLDTNLDRSTFKFEEIGFLKWNVDLEPCQYFNVNVDLRPDKNLIVNVEGTFDPETGNITWVFRSLNATTLFPPEGEWEGFLPPMNDTGYEIGWVSFSIDSKSDLPSGTQIKNQAYVEFDSAGDLLYHPAPKEGPFVNTIDAEPPKSNINGELLKFAKIQLNWTGFDNESGIKDYTIYVSKDGNSYEKLIQNTKESSAIFNGEYGNTYYFYSIAEDYIGHKEELKAEPDLIIYIPEPIPPEISISSPSDGDTVNGNSSISYLGVAHK